MRHKSPPFHCWSACILLVYPMQITNYAAQAPYTCTCITEPPLLFYTCLPNLPEYVLHRRLNRERKQKRRQSGGRADLSTPAAVRHAVRRGAYGRLPAIKYGRLPAGNCEQKCAPRQFEQVLGVIRNRQRLRWLPPPARPAGPRCACCLASQPCQPAQACGPLSSCVALSIHSSRPALH